MSQLKLYGMKAAYDEIIATAIKRQHEPQKIAGDLLSAEIARLRQRAATGSRPTPKARSIKYQMTIARLPLAKEVHEFDFDATPVNETLIRELARGGFLKQQRKVALIGETGTGESRLAVVIARACTHTWARGRFFNVVDLVNSSTPRRAQTDRPRGRSTPPSRLPDWRRC